MKTEGATLIVLIVMLSIFAPLSTDMYLPALDEMIEFFTTNEATMSMTLYMFMLFLAIGILVLGTVSDKYGRRKVLLWSLAVYIVSSLVCSVAPNIEVLIISRIFQAVGGGGAMATATALIRDCFEDDRRDKVLTIVAVIGVLGPVLSPIIGQVLIWTLGWQSTFWIPAVLALVCMAIASGLSPEIPIERYEGTVVESLSTMGPLIRYGDFRRFTIMMTMVTFCVLAYISVSEYIYKDKGFGVGDAYTLYLASAMILGVLIMLFLQKFSARIGNRNMLKVIFLLSFTSLLVLAFLSSRSPILFLAGVVPLIAVSSLVRSFGLSILMAQDGNSGAISSLVNFSTFFFATLGMIVVVNLPFGDYITSLTFCVLLYFAVYVLLWTRMAVKGTTLKGME